MDYLRDEQSILSILFMKNKNGNIIICARVRILTNIFMRFIYLIINGHLNTQDTI